MAEEAAVLPAAECTVCGRNDVVTDETDVPRCSRHVLDDRTFEVEVILTVKLSGDEEAAYAQVDTIMQRAWDTDRGRHHVGPWHFAMLEGCVADVTKDVQD